MIPSVASVLPVVLLAGPLTSPPALVATLVVLLLVVLVGRVLLSLAWRLVTLALVVVLALWLLGLVGLGPW